MIDVLFRVDDGPGIGAGHLMRCRALAEAVSDRGGKPHLLAWTGSPLHSDWPNNGAQLKIHGLRSGGDKDLDATLRFADDIKADWIVADGYIFDTFWLESLARRHRLLYLDDLGCRDARTDLVLNQNAGAQDNYRTCYSRANRALLGLKWFLLGRTWQAEYPKPISDRILVSLGGDDQQNLSLDIMQALLASNQPFHADVVTSAPNPGYILSKKLAASMPECFTVHRAPVNLAPLMARAMVTICGGGVTTIEAASLGVPAIVITLSDNQVPGASVLAAKGVACVVKPKNDFISVAVALALGFLLDRKKRAAFSQNSRGLVDGKGPSRVLAALEKEK